MSRDDGVMQSGPMARGSRASGRGAVDRRHRDEHRCELRRRRTSISTASAIRWQQQVGQPTWGYNPVAVARFQQATVAPIGRCRPIHSGRSGAGTRSRDRAKGLHRELRDPASVRVSADTITYGNGRSRRGLAEHARVLRAAAGLGQLDARGILDLNIPMNYKRDQTTRATSGACIRSGVTSRRTSSTAARSRSDRLLI
jgi:hypothetical protein